MTPQKSEKNIQTFSHNIEAIASSVLLAFERTGTKPERLEGLVRDIVTEFSDASTEDITEAIKKGSLGFFGMCYKISTMQVCVWIREYLKIKSNQPDVNFVYYTTQLSDTIKKHPRETWEQFKANEQIGGYFLKEVTDGN